MAKDREDIELAFNIELETRKAMRSISDIDRQLRKTISQKLQIKAFDSGGIRAFSKELARSKRTLREISFSMSPATRRKFKGDFASMGKSYRDLTAIALRERKKVSALEKMLAKEENEEIKKGIEQQLDAQKKASAKEIKQARKAYDAKRHAFGKKIVSSGAGAEIQKRGEQARQAQEFIKGIKSHKTGAVLAEGFKEAVDAMKGKDLFSLGKAGMKMSGSLLKGLAKTSMAKGAGIAAKGSEMGGATGAALKGIGGAMKGIGPLLGTLSKLGPMLGMVGGALFALVKLFLDADAAVKEMNKTVLEGGSTWDTYAAAGKNVELGMGRMDASLRRMRDETTDLRMNLNMGTTAKDHQQVINTLQREGITLQQLTVGFDKYTDITKQSIAYSRLFGVSVDEIAQMNAEMMTQMGMGLGELSNQFDMIGRAAEESGIAQNKFFAMLRGVSSDLALYGVRIGETTKMLGQLGKVMSPRTADKFLKEFAKGFQGTSITDRLKATLLGGSKGIDVLKKSVAEQKEDLISQVMRAAPSVTKDQAAEILKGKKVGGVSLKGLEKSGKIKGSGSMQEAYQNLDLATKQLQKGTYGAAMALENVGGIGAYLQKKEQLRATAGTSSFEKAMSGVVGGERYAALAAGGEEQAKAMLGMERAINQQKNDLVGAIDGTSEEQEMLLKTLKKYGKIDEKMSAKDLAGQKDLIEKQIESLTETQLWKSLDEKNADANKTQAEKDAEAMRQLGEKQGQLTQSISDKLELIFDALYNQIYGILTDLYSIFKVGGKLEKKVYKSTNKDITKAWRESGGDQGKYMGMLAGSSTGKKIDELLHSKDPSQAGNKKAQGQYIMDMMKDFSVSGNTQRDLGDAAKAVGISAKQVYAMQSKLIAGGSVSEAVGAGNISEDQKADLLSKMALWFTNAEGRTALMEGSQGYLGGIKGAAAPVAASSSAPSGQQAAAAKSDSPGTGGAAIGTPASSSASMTPAGGGFFSNAPSAPDEKKMSEAVMDQIDFTGEATVNSLQDLWKALRMKGIKLDKTQLTGDVQEVIHKGTHLGAQDALFEYALYTSTNPADTLKKMKASGFEGLATSAKSFEDQQAKAAAGGSETLIGNADGGIVTGVSGGFANVNPAPGEGLASIGRGERILPAGAGGGGDVHLHVNGLGGADLANFLKGQIAQGIHEYKRREKFS